MGCKNEELHNLYHPPNIVGVIKSKKIEMVRMEEGRIAFKILTFKIYRKETSRKA